MAKEFTVRLAHTPGSLAHVGELLGKAKVNIEAIQLIPCEGVAVFQFVVDQPDYAAKVLDEHEISYTTREVLLVNVLDEPGMLGTVAYVMSQAGINIDAAYITIKGQIILGVDDLDGAIQVAAGMAVM